ncbi:hypothetical protein [Butyrivibrio sp. YAB3001]|uniref:hypothetical protein n=1 Tax=Butyrivibrio sp. YAB3001 TaxID=1520812 RepID=UPI0008F66688|nr:hypothetical protein [Butyrivibrio sp. YAB3001]SFB75466.1 hypothetical protein SAMN02910398_00624 [Butyrivibrio sp. YAB3001]
MASNMQKMSSYKSQIEKYGTPISKEVYSELALYAEKNHVFISGFKDFVGDIEVIKQVIDDIVVIAKDFPLIISGKTAIELNLDYDMGTDFATTKNRHIIHLNAVYYSDLNILNADYIEGVAERRFVSNTDWHSVIKHEVGHVVANIYRLKPMEIAKDVLKMNREIQVLEYLTDELSLYSTELEDGREIISEAFSGYYGKAGNEFADKYVNRCIQITREGGTR